MHATDPAPENPLDIMVLLGALASRKLVLALSTLLGLLVAIVYLHLTTHRYRADIHVLAAEDSSDGLAGVLSKVSSIAPIAGLAGGAAKGATSPFKLFLEAIYLPETSQRLAADVKVMRSVFPDLWDSEQGAWTLEAPLRRTVADGMRNLVGAPVQPWRAPDARDLQRFIAGKVVVDEDSKRAIVTISFEHRDPDFAAGFLSALYRTVDDDLRRRTLDRSTRNAAYLAAKLQTVSVLEQKMALATLLSDEEKKIMLASSGAPYAAQLFGQPTVTSGPISPNPLFVLLTGLLGGLLVGVLAALWRPLSTTLGGQRIALSSSSATTFAE
jgi:hypothetical protein